MQTVFIWVRYGKIQHSFNHWTCAVFSHIARKNEHRLYFLTRSTHTWHIQPYIVLNLQLECDMGWYQYTSHSENQCTECENTQFGDLCLRHVSVTCVSPASLPSDCELRLRHASGPCVCGKYNKPLYVWYSGKTFFPPWLTRSSF